MFEEQKEKEIVIKLKSKSLKTFLVVFLVLILVGVITAQYYYYPNCKRCACTESEKPAVAPPTPAESVKIAPEPAPEVTLSEPKNTTDVKANSSINNSQISSAAIDPSKLPITGAVTFTIDQINIEVRGDDYARVMSVKYTIKNQNKAFVPHLKAWITVDTDDVKEMDIPILEAGDSVTKTEARFTFGYNEINSSKTLIMELSDSGKLVKSVTKTFKTN